ncbi:MAG: GNAT family protein [Elainellaceae cyanobacterium]
MLWEWANDAIVRAASFSSDPIPWDSHIRWLSQKLNEPNCLFYIASDENNIPIGQVRFDVDPSEPDVAEISINLAPNQRGYGYGSKLIDIAIAHLFRTISIQRVRALIKPDNRASIAAFERSHFQKIALRQVSGNLALQYERVRPT